jgi:hypothetical protein
MQSIVSQYSIGTSESGVYLARIIGDDVQIWTASMTASKVQILWEGNTSEKRFKISEATDASGGNWEVIGGGSIAGSSSQMAFRARNNQNNASADEYYLAITLDDLEKGNAQTIVNALTNPPDPGTSNALSYITEGDTNCPEFLFEPKYPQSLDDLAWVQ